MNINEGDEMDSILDEEELAENPRSINASQINQKETALNEKSLMRELSKLAAEQSTQETHLASTQEQNANASMMNDESTFLM